MSPYIFATFLSMLGLGTTITFASSHWFLAWMGLEINTLAILPLMVSSHHPRATEAATKYFMAQATAASALLFAAVTNAWLVGQWDMLQLNHPLPIALAILALAMKLGVAPFHFWLPEVLQGLNFFTALILLTWQKLAPLALLTYTEPSNHTLLLSMGLLSALVGGFGGLNQNELRKIFAYSSIAHLGWMMLALPFSRPLALFTLLIYLIMTAATLLTLEKMRVTKTHQLSIACSGDPLLTALLLLILLSLAGLPPLMGFAPKWFILHELVAHNLNTLATLAALSALFSLYFYLRLCTVLVMTIPPNTATGTSTWRLRFSRIPTPLMLTAVISLASFPFTPSFLTMMTKLIP
uniref:NADH dehydrogenase subunit 2 n=1 Tax=Parascombrops philippinensis TaxID=2937804 RepID=UPI001FF29860|nr:NADH dehydrogenase subunit 2 [Synagrops philippinensis]UOK10010.1 NADH dehydrogenase subunit 2 [Synagrops philippinensis]UVN21642.1 NADH dehydrogenase subunit 2 [Synagrops philippinensis]